MATSIRNEAAERLDAMENQKLATYLIAEYYLCEAQLPSLEAGLSLMRGERVTNAYGVFVP